ncbi:MAG: response regulator [Polyangiaceae bacterium]
MHVLLVEDNPVFAQALFDMLDESEHEVLLSHVTHIADLARFVQRVPDALLLDLALPDAEGLESLRRAQAALPGVPIVVLTADHDAERALEIVRLGAQDYLVKRSLAADAVVRSVRYAVERAQSERLRRRLLQADRLAAVGRLAAGVAHEISNPAAYVQASAALMDTHLQAANQALEHVQHARSASELSERLATLQRELGELQRVRDETAAGVERICSVVADLRGYTRLDSGEISEIQPNEVVHSVCQLVAGLVRHKAQLVKDLHEVSAVALAPGRLDQVITNLLVNAAQSISEGSPGMQCITVSTRQRDSDVLIVVEDTGSGMSEEQQRHVFEPFFSTKPRGEGMGLGLSICADIVAAYGGRIRCESALGRGSRFEVRLPGAEPPVAKPFASAPPAPPSGERLRVLLIDDEPYILQTYALLMKGEFDVFTAADGAHALSQVEACPSLDLLICDVMMPDMDASQLISRLKARRPELASRVVLHTGGAMTETTRRLVESGEFPVFYKPLTVDDMSAAIRSLAAGRRATGTS